MIYLLHRIHLSISLPKTLITISWARISTLPRTPGRRRSCTCRTAPRRSCPTWCTRRRFRAGKNIHRHCLILLASLNIGLGQVGGHTTARRRLRRRPPAPARPPGRPGCHQPYPGGGLRSGAIQEVPAGFRRQGGVPQGLCWLRLVLPPAPDLGIITLATLENA